MARVPYRHREDAGPEHRALYDRLERERGKPVENIFLALANVPEICDAALTMAMTLRKGTTVSRAFRELAVLAVGHASCADYEVAHHANAALKAGLRREQVDNIAASETHPAYNREERIVIRYAREATRNGRVVDATWRDLRGVLGEKEALELVVTVAWYNGIARILLPLEIELEDDFVPL